MLLAACRAVEQANLRKHDQKLPGVGAQHQQSSSSANQGSLCTGHEAARGMDVCLDIGAC